MGFPGSRPVPLLPPVPQLPGTADWMAMLDPFSTFSQPFLNCSLFFLAQGVR
jgi:hypothetical protein